MSKSIIGRFKKGGWKGIAIYYLTHPKQLFKLLKKAKQYASKKGLKNIKSDFLTLIHYVKDIMTGKYKGYSFFKLVSIVAVIVYVVSPLDIIPDFVPTGLIDDVAIVLWALKEGAEEISKYKMKTAAAADNEDK